MKKNSDGGECVKVAVRCRPLSGQEKIDNRKVVVNTDQKRGNIYKLGEIKIQNVKAEQTENDKQYTFDVVMGANVTQTYVYEKTALPVIESVLDGYNGTIFAYGQTGTGKTFTMEGVYEDKENCGIIPRAFEHIFRVIEGTPDKKFLVMASYLELYNEEVRDLLSQNYINKLELKENVDKSVYVKNLSQSKVNSINDLHLKLAQGKKNRQVAKTDMNNDSSRSHSIFMITVEMATMFGDGQQRIAVGKLNLVDLAGSERQDKTHAQGERFKEAITINKSLSTLGNVISALVDKKEHIPYRDSKLTRLLQDSLGGNTKTVMIANVGPADYNYDETINTLRYANRAKNIKNQPHINEDPKDSKIREFQEEIQRLREKLQGNGKVIVNKDGTIQRVEEIVTIKKVQDTAKIQQLQQQHQQEINKAKQEMEMEKQRIMDEKNKNEQEKKELLRKLAQQNDLEKQKQIEQQQMIQKLKEFENEILQGSNIQAEKREKEKKLIQIQMEKEQQDIEQRRIADQLQQKNMIMNELESDVKNIQDDIDQKNKKIQFCLQKLTDLKSQKDEIHEQRIRENEIMMEENRNMDQELKFMELIIQNFIQPEEVEKLTEKLVYNELEDEYTVQQVPKSNKNRNPGSALNLKYPMCEASRMAVNFGDENARFRHDNIMTLDIEISDRTSEQEDSKIQKIIDIALKDNEEELQQISSESMPNVYIEDPNLIKRKEDILNSKQRAQSGKQKKRIQSGLRK